MIPIGTTIGIIVAPWQNVSQDEVPVTPVTCDDDTDTWETPGGNLIQTWPFVDLGDD